MCLCGFASRWLPDRTQAAAVGVAHIGDLAAGAGAFHDDYLAAEAALMARAAEAVPPACPSWCERPAGHPYSANFTDYESADPELVVGDGYWRGHELTVSEFVRVTAGEHMRTDGTVTLHPAVVELSERVADLELDADAAYDLGDDLNTAAKRCGAIRAGGAQTPSEARS